MAVFKCSKIEAIKVSKSIDSSCSSKLSDQIKFKLLLLLVMSSLEKHLNLAVSFLGPS